jgi:hypothetical protein
MINVFQIGRSEEIVQGNRRMASTETAVLIYFLKKFIAYPRLLA